MRYPYDMTPADIEAFELAYAEAMISEQEDPVNRLLREIASEER